MPKVDLAKKQIDLVERLDKLTLAIWRAWLIRDLDKVPLPPQPVLAQRLWEGGERIRDSLFAHAEVLALEGIVTPDQADGALTAVWEQNGMRALLDPTLAARLRLTPSQREAVFFLLESKKGILKDLSEAQWPLRRLVWDHPELRGQIEQLDREAEDREQEVDRLILSDILTAPQARILMRILGTTKQPAPHPATKTKRRSRQG